MTVDELLDVVEGAVVVREDVEDLPFVRDGVTFISPIMLKRRVIIV